MSQRFGKKVLIIVASIFGLGLIFQLVANLAGEILWFEELGYLQTLLRRWQSEFLLWLIAISFSVIFLLGNLQLADRLKWRLVKSDRREIVNNQSRSNSLNLPSQIRSNSIPYLRVPHSPAIGLSILLILVLLFCLLIALMVLHYSSVALDVWQPEYRVTSVAPPIPSPFQIASVSEVFRLMSEHLWQVFVFFGLIFLLLIFPLFWLRVIAILLSFIFGLVISGNWARVWQYFHPTAFDQTDPQFKKDISFYVFNLPLWQLLDFWLGGLFLFGLLACFLVYLLSGNSLSEGRFPGLSRSQLRHLYANGALATFTLALGHWLNGYELLYSSRGVTYGASYTDVNIQLPLERVLLCLALAIGIWLSYKAITGATGRINFLKTLALAPKISLAIVPFFIYIFLLIFSFLTTETVQRFGVQPNELAREELYIKRSIAATRSAFDLSSIEAETFDPTGKLTAADLENNYLTIDNIRLWDTHPLLQTNRQLQQIRLYYKFPDADIDRYTFKLENSTPAEAKNLAKTLREKQQVIIAPRELDYSAVPRTAKTWVNQHLVYTHGYGFTVSPVNKADQGGLPYYYVKDIGTAKVEGDLRTSNQLIEETIPIDKPRIYYGELTNDYVMTSTRVREFDFPSGEDNAYNTYDGTGGIKIGNYGRRLLFACYLRDWQMLFTNNFTSSTKLLFRRNINQRIRAIAPFLYFDRDPYLVAANTQKSSLGETQSYLYWIIDAYTTSDRYPYSDPGKNQFNYIRNSVKIVVDAYNGDVNFYIADPEDPILQTWTKVFPKLFKSMDAMPTALRSHIRYPEDLFSIQSERLLTYHMTDPQVFYNREDQWEIPKEIYGNKSQPVEPYYLIMKLPTEEKEEFILLHPFTPTSRPNLVGWLAARSDGEKYGRLLLYQFPKQKLVYGPNQIEALINQDPVISQRISLWNREGSKAIQGNLLIIPIEQSLLYVEPLYLVAEQNSLPTLVQVIVVYENRIVMAETLQEALQTIFNPDRRSNSSQSKTPTIVRPLE